MAASSAAVRSGKMHTSFDATFTADGDTTLSITHGLYQGAGSPIADANKEVQVTIEPLLPNAYVSQLVVTSRSASAVVIGKTNAVGAGNAGAQARIHCRRIVSPQS